MVYQYCMWYTSIYKYPPFYSYNNNTSSMWYTIIVCGIPVLYVVYHYCMWYNCIVCGIPVLYVVYQYCMWYTSIYKYSPFYNSNNNTSSMRVYQYCMWYTSIYNYNYNNWGILGFKMHLSK